MGRNTKRAFINAIKLRSKTVNVNVVIGSLVTLLQQFGVVLDAGTVGVVIALANIALRFITDQPLEDKGEEGMLSVRR